MKYYLLTFETRNFTFTLLSKNPDPTQLAEAWNEHCRQTGADPDYFDTDSVSVQEMKIGQAYRDHEPINSK